MIVLIPLAWPFLVIYLMFRFWRVTLLLLAVAAMVYVYNQSTYWGIGLFVTALGTVFLILHTREADRVAAAKWAADQEQVNYGYEQ